METKGVFRCESPPAIVNRRDRSRSTSCAGSFDFAGGPRRPRHRRHPGRDSIEASISLALIPTATGKALVVRLVLQLVLQADGLAIEGETGGEGLGIARMSFAPPRAWPKAWRAPARRPDRGESLSLRHRDKWRIAGPFVRALESGRHRSEPRLAVPQPIPSGFLDRFLRRRFRRSTLEHRSLSIDHGFARPARLR